VESFNIIADALNLDIWNFLADDWSFLIMMIVTVLVLYMAGQQRRRADAQRQPARMRTLYVAYIAISVSEEYALANWGDQLGLPLRSVVDGTIKAILGVFPDEQTATGFVTATEEIYRASIPQGDVTTDLVHFECAPVAFVEAGQATAYAKTMREVVTKK
jgi:hypothetical protein